MQCRFGPLWKPMAVGRRQTRSSKCKAGLSTQVSDRFAKLISMLGVLANANTKEPFPGAAGLTPLKGKFWRIQTTTILTSISECRNVRRRWRANVSAAAKSRNSDRQPGPPPRFRPRPPPPPPPRLPPWPVVLGRFPPGLLAPGRLPPGLLAPGRLPPWPVVIPGRLPPGLLIPGRLPPGLLMPGRLGP
jgi:hypothetical protein